MKPLGPYVAARDLPGRMNSPVRTLRATDRLTGMPVLLHGLPAPQPVPDLPDHPSVLLPSECVQVAGEAFMVTEMPLQARPAQDPDLTARGALAALAALHGRGVVHGGLSASQLWSVDGEVRLAGAGLPWGGDARPGDDLYALAVILHEMGGVPAPLRPLLDEPGRLDAHAALRLLRAPTPQRDAAPAAPAPAALEAAAPARSEPEPTAPDSGLPEVRLSAPPAPAPERPSSPLPTTPVPAEPVPAEAIPARAVQAEAVQAETVQPAASPTLPVPAAPDVPVRAETSGSRGRRGRGSRFRLPGLSAPRDAATPDAPTDVDTPPASDEARSESGEIAPAVPDAVLPERAPSAPVGQEAAEAAPVRSDVPAHDGTPIVLGDPAPTGSATIESTAVESPAAEDAPAVAEPDAAVTPSAPVTPAAPVLTAAPVAQAAPVSPDAQGVPAGPVGRLSPQERRRREHEARREQTERDARAAADRRLQRLEQQRAQTPAQPSGQSPAQAVAPAPIQIGFDDLPEWEVDAPAPRPQVQIREVPRLPESLRRAPLPATDADGAAEAEGNPLQDGATGDMPVGTLPARRRAGDPIRIGWDEDDSWRVVREAPAPVRPRRPLLWRVAFWALLAVAFVGMALVLVRVVQARGQGQAEPAQSVPLASGSGEAPVAAAPQPQTVPFTVRGVAGATARLSVEQSPKEANLTPGASLGTAPGRVTFPAPGTYRLRVVVDGFAPGSMTVTVPRAQPVTIDLDR